MKKENYMKQNIKKQKLLISDDNCDDDNFDEDKVREQAKMDPFYKQYQRMNKNNKELRKRGVTKFLSNIVQQSWNEHKWRKLFVQQMNDKEYCEKEEDVFITHRNTMELTGNDNIYLYDNNDNPEINTNTITFTTEEFRTTEEFNSTNSSL